MFDLKVLHSAIGQLEEEKGISKEATLEAIQTALAAAYKKEYGRKGQIVRASFDPASGKTEFSQVKIVVDESTVRMPEDEEEEAAAESFGEPKGEEKKPAETDEEDLRPRFNPEHHILLEDAQKIKKGVQLEDEIIFQLEDKEDFGRIAAQTAKQVIIQKIREAEKNSVVQEFGQKEGEIVSGTVQRTERGNIYVDLGKAIGVLAYEDQIPRERYKQGERVRAYLVRVEEGFRGVLLRISRTHPKFIEKLFEIEAPEIASGTVEIKAIAREPGSRSKIAVYSEDAHIDPIGSCVGQRGVRVATVMSELGGEKIDIIEWSPDPAEFIADALSPAKAISVEIDEEEKTAIVIVPEDQLSLAIGKGGQNARLAARLTGWKIDIETTEGPRRGAGEEKKEETPADPEEVAVKQEEAASENTKEEGGGSVPEETVTDTEETETESAKEKKSD